MPATSGDTFANTNPAFCTLVLRAFVEGYLQSDVEGVPFPYVVLALPIVLSSEFAATFVGTNATTGLLTWVGRHPEVTIGLSERVAASAQFSREAILFGLTRRVLGVNDRGRVVLETDGLARKIRFSAADIRRALSNAQRLGRWVADVRSIETVFTSLGINR